MADLPSREELLEKGKAVREDYHGLRYLRHTDDFRRIPRGTATFGNTSVWGYPRIGRILRLRTGLEQQFHEGFWIEEKVDGYNVRVFRLGDEVLALTRGGFVCPFTTDRLPDLLDTRILEEHPDLVVCAEVAGPDNPYLEGYPPYVEEDVRLFAFDFMRLGQPGFLEQRRKLALMERYAVPAVEMYGHFHAADLERIRALMLRLNGELREGVVLKEDGGDGRRAKYVTANSNITDIRVTAQTLTELPPTYYTNRILRLALFMEEEGIEREPELLQRLGDAFLEGLFESIRQFRAEHQVSHRFRCRLRERRSAHRLLEHLKRAGPQMQVIRRSLEQRDGYHVLEFDKVYPGMTGLLGDLLSGGLMFD